MNRLWMGITLLVALTAIAVLGALAAAEVEPNNNFTTANPITPGTYSGTLAADIDEDDYYSFTVTAGQGIQATLRSPGNDYIYLALYNWEQNPTYTIRSMASVAMNKTYWTANETGTHTWFLDINLDNVAGPYEFDLALISPDDGGLGVDAGGSLDDANVVLSGTVFSGHLGDLDGTDDFMFWAGTGDIISVQLWGHTTNDEIRLDIYTDATHTVMNLKSKAMTLTSADYYTANETPMHWWFVSVYFGTEVGYYDFNLTVTRQSDAGTGRDVGGSMNSATTILSGAYGGHLQDLDRDDYYMFWAGRGDAFAVGINGSTSNDFINLELRDPQGDVVFTLKSKAYTPHDRTYYTKNETSPVWWYVHVYYEAEHGDYELTLNITKQDDAGSGFDVSETMGQACVIGPGSYAGHVQDLDEFDFYKFRAGAGDVVTIEISAEVVGDYIYATLMAADEITILEAKCAANDLGNGTFYTANETAVQWYFINVHMGTEPGDYSVRLVITRQDDAGLGVDAAGAIASARTLASGTYTGMLGDLDTADYYSFVVKGAWVVHINLTNAQMVTCAVAVISDATTEVAIGTVTSSSGQMGSGSWTVPVTVPEGTHWYIKVVGATDWVPGGYTLELYLQQTPPDLETPMITFTDPTAANENKPLTLTPTVTDNVAVASVMLYFAIDDEVTWHALNMTAGANNQYAATIPASAIRGNVLKFYIIAKDTSGNDRLQGSAASPRQVQITPADTVPPVIAYKPPSSATRDKPLTVSMSVTDNIGVADVMLYFKIDDEVTWHSIAMLKEGDTYTGTIPAANMTGKTLHYYILARDTSGTGQFYGTETAPKSMPIKAAKKTPGFEAVAAAAAVGAALVVVSRRRR